MVVSRTTGVDRSPSLCDKDVTLWWVEPVQYLRQVGGGRPGIGCCC